MTTGPWGIACTALLFLLSLLIFSGCRKPAPLRQGWVRVDQLTALHPEQAMVADIDRRLASLVAQKQHLAGVTAPVAPPMAVETASPAFSAPLEPHASPQLDRHTDQLLAQRLESFAQLLERDRLRKVNLFRRHQLETITAEKEQVRQGPLDKAKARRAELQEEFMLPLTDAKVALRITQAVVAKDRSPQTIRDMEKAQAKYDAVYSQYQKRLQKTQENAKKEIADAEQRIDDAYDAALEAYDKQVKKANADLYEQKRAELAAEADTDPSAVRVPAMTMAATPAGKQILEAPGLDDQFHASSQQQARNQQVAASDIDRVIAQLRRERQELRTRITRDTLEAAKAVAATNGYQVSADANHGTEMTDKVKGWLADYWQ